MWGRKAHLKKKNRDALLAVVSEFRSYVKVEVDVPNSPYSLCGRKATLNSNLL